MCLFIPHISRHNKITVHDDADLIGFRPAVGPLPRRLITVASTIFNNNEIEVVSAKQSSRTASLPRGRGKFYSDKNGGDCVEIRLTPEGIQKVTPEGLQAYNMSHEKGILLMSCNDSESGEDLTIGGAVEGKEHILARHTERFKDLL